MYREDLSIDFSKILKCKCTKFGSGRGSEITKSTMMMMMGL